MISSKGTAFTYQPLIAPDSFRLLLIQPSLSNKSHVSCRILHTTLSAYDCEIIDHYIALSYVWGSPSDTAQVSLDRHDVTITATLEAAIRDLRDETRVVRLWADALCIDQSNVEERNQQVRQMGRIYRTAQHTVIYLGPLTGSVEDVLLAVEERHPIDGNKREGVVKIAEADLLMRPWFRRVWVFQELVLSRDPWVQCGRVRVRWTDLCSLLLWETGTVTGKIKLLRDMQYAKKRQVGSRLLDLLLLRRGLGATDPRDMVYAQLSLASDLDAVERYLRVDYENPVPRVYEDVARYMLDSIGPERMFFETEDVDPKLRCEGLASWAPDWRLSTSYSRPMFPDNRMNTMTLDAKAHYVFTQMPSILAYMGYDVEVISSVSLSLPPSFQMNGRHRVEYQKTVQDIASLYASRGGTYSVGDEHGRYTRISLQCKIGEHENLCLKLHDEWMRILRNEVPSIAPSISDNELSLHTNFLETFSTWMRSRAKEEIIFTGSDSEGLLSNLWRYLLPNPISTVLDGRRMAGMESGHVGIVPPQARAGDFVVFLAGTPVPVLLRDVASERVGDVNKEIVEAFKMKDGSGVDSSSQYVTSFAQLFEETEVEIRHARFVGECFVDGAIGWRHNGQFERKIFALH